MFIEEEKLLNLELEYLTQDLPCDLKIVDNEYKYEINSELNIKEGLVLEIESIQVENEFIFHLETNSLNYSSGIGSLVIYNNEVISKDTPVFETIYGDSVIGSTPLILKDKNTNKIVIKSIQDLGSVWKEFPLFKIGDLTSIKFEKEFSLVPEYQIWTDTGFVDIKKVIRHFTNKRIYKITTNCGSVCVTEDHSLCSLEGQKIKPSDINLQDQLLHSFPQIKNENNITFLELMEYIQKFRNYGIIDDELLNYSNYAQSIFINLIIDKNNQTNNYKMIFCDTTQIQKFYLLVNNIGMKIEIVEWKENQLMFKIVNCISFPYAIHKIEVYDTGNEYNYVYDLETETGKFNAGIGQITVFNTDSVFISFKGIAEQINLQDKTQVSSILKECFSIGEEMANEATTLFKKPIELEFEKVYLPFISFGKKTYTGIMYEPPVVNKFKVDNKGIVLKRRDNPNITKIVYQGILDILFSEGKTGIKRAVCFLEDKITEILEDKVSLEDLVVSKTYKTGYKSENVPHKVLAEKMYQRDPGNAPTVNERVPYVFIEVKNKNAAQYEKIEHPEYVKEHKLKIDSLYYIDQIKNPITQLLSTFMKETEVNKIFEKHKRDYELKRKGIQKITNFFPIKTKN